MDADRFGTLTTHLAGHLTRRGLGVLAALGVSVTAPGPPLEAKKKKKPKKCKTGAVTCGAACVDTWANA